MLLSSWHILIIENHSATHSVVRLLEKLRFLHKPIRVSQVQSFDAAKIFLKSPSGQDIALILMDIMSVNRTVGLDFIRYIRNTLNNTTTRIILRTGYPYVVPDKQTIEDYQIDGYVSQEDISHTSLEISVMTAIRTYNQMRMHANIMHALAGSIAHEIRNPFNAVAGYNAAIENHLPKLTTKTAEQTYQISEQNLQQIHQALTKSNHAIQLGGKITEAILLSLKNQAIDPIAFIEQPASNIINYTLENYSYSESTDKNLIKTNTKDDFLLLVNQDLLIYVLFNLIKNALYYKNKPGFQIQITTETDKERNFIKIKDNGPGIPQNKLEQIFENFYTEGKKGGTGLGLAFCKHMMHAFQGDIICKSEQGNWTEFTLSFPKANSKVLSEIKNSPTPKPPETLLPGLNEMQQALANKRFLMVDDEESNRYAIKMLLQNTNCQLHEARNGQEALEAVKQHLYDAILSDLNMPELNGDQMTQMIRKNLEYQKNQHTPIFMITGKTGDKDKQAMLQSGITDILSKPINKHMLISTLYKHLIKETESKTN